MTDAECLHLGYCPYRNDPHGPPGAQLARETMAIVLAGGRGSRLGLLSEWRAKPALPFAGKYRIIDFTLSNCVNSGIRRVGICTQYKAQSLIRHVQHAWSIFDGRFNEFIELLPAQQRVTTNWYAGTADAIYQNVDILRTQSPRFVLVLAGDHVYKMDYSKMLADHVGRGADMTIACLEIPVEDARAFGVMQVDASDRIVAFQEKPAQPQGLPDRPDRALVSMGIYCFNTPLLYEQLIRDADTRTSSHDFGKDIIPYLIERGYRVLAHRFASSCVNMVGDQPYWRDVGTIDAYWEANLDLVQVTPALNLYDQAWPIWTHQEQLPPAKFVFDDDNRRGTAIDSLVSGGCIISGSTVRRSLLFSNVYVHSYCEISDSVILPDVDIARGVVLKRAVVEKGCRLPAGLQVGVDHEADRRRFLVTDGGVTVIAPQMLGQEVHQVP